MTLFSKNTYNVYGHSNESGYYINHKLINSDALVGMIQADPTYKVGMSVKIWSCNLAEATSYVQDIANKLGSNVIVSTGYVWYGSGKIPYPATRTIDSFRAFGIPDQYLRNRFIGSGLDKPLEPRSWKTVKPSN